MFIREKEGSKINVYELTIDKKKLIKLQKELIDDLFKEDIKSLELYSSWKNKDEFLSFLFMDKHKGSDFYFNEGYYNSGGDDYINVRGIKEKLLKEDIHIPFSHTFMVNPDSPFIKRTTTSKFDHYILKLNSDNIEYKENLLLKKDAFYAVNDLGNLKYGVYHTSNGYIMQKLFQIPYTVFYADKILKGKFDIVDEALKKETNINEILNCVILNPNCTSHMIDKLYELIDKESFDRLMNQASNTTTLVKTLKK